MLELSVRKSFADFTLECEARLGDGVTAIFGPSGSGKSTLLNSIAGLVRPDDGENTFRGRDAVLVGRTSAMCRLRSGGSGMCSRILRCFRI